MAATCPTCLSATQPIQTPWHTTCNNWHAACTLKLRQHITHPFRQHQIHNKTCYNIQQPIVVIWWCLIAFVNKHVICTWSMLQNHVCTCAHIYTHRHAAHMHVHTYTHTLHMHAHIHTHGHTSHMHGHTYTHTHARAHTHRTFMHTYTHTYT